MLVKKLPNEIWLHTKVIRAKNDVDRILCDVTSLNKADTKNKGALSILNPQKIHNVIYDINDLKNTLDHNVLCSREFLTVSEEL